MANGASVLSPKVTSVIKGRQVKRPRDGKEFVGVLVGGYKDTREEIKKELWKRYGIRIATHFGLEKQKERTLYVQSNAEICVILADDVKNMLPRVLAACKAGGIENIGISRKMHTWDESFLAQGFTNPPKWRDGFEADFAAKFDLKKIEEERQAELKDIDERPTRTAWVDPGLRPAKIADVVPEVVATTKAPAAKKPQPFGQVVKAFREAKGWSKGVLAEKLGITPGGVEQWESGKVKVPFYAQYMKLRALIPDFPEMKGLRGEKIALAREAALDKKHGKSTPVLALAPEPARLLPEPAPEPLLVAPEAQEAIAPAPILRVQPAPTRVPTTPAPAAHVRSYVLAGSLDEYKAALDELQVTGAALQEAQARHEEVLARVDAIHKLVTGR